MPTGTTESVDRTADPTPVPPPTAAGNRHSPVPATAATPGGCPTAAAAATEDPALLERIIETLRARCFALSVVELTLAVLCIGVCWVGYGFTVLLSISLIVVSIISIVHFRTPVSLRQSTCCCFPLNTIRQMHTAHIICSIFALLSLASSAVQGAMRRGDDNVTLAACIIDGVISLITLAVTVATLRSLCSLSTFCQQDPSFAQVPLPPQPYHAGGYGTGCCLAPGAMPHYYAAGAYIASPPHHHHHHHGYGAQYAPTNYYYGGASGFVQQPGAGGGCGPAVYTAQIPAGYAYPGAGPNCYPAYAAQPQPQVVAPGSYYAGTEEYCASHRGTPALAQQCQRSPGADVHPSQPTPAAKKTTTH